MAPYSRQLEQRPEVVAREGWGVDARPAEWERDQSYTGKTFARLSTAGGELFLRRLPPGTSASWLEAVHEGVAHLEQRGCGLFPGFLVTDGGGSLVRHHGDLYELAPWAAGDPVDLPAMSPRHLANLGEAIAGLHVAGSGAAGPTPRLDWLPHRVRLTMRLAWDPVPHGPKSWHRVDNLAAFFRPLALAESPTHVDESATAVVTAANDVLTWLEGAPPGADLASDRPTLTHGDLWIDHVRFVEDQVASLVDVDTLALRPPPGDVAALCADFGLWDVERCRAIIAGYRRRRPVSPECLAALPRLGALRTLGVLRERLSAWLDPDRRSQPEAFLGGPVPYWQDQLRTLMDLDVERFSRI